MADLNWQSAAEITASIQAGTTTAGAVIDAALVRIDDRNGVLNAFTDVTAERARARAYVIDAERAANRPIGPLAGVPFAVKNLFDVDGLPTRAGSFINRERPPATQDAVLIRRLERAGAILVGALDPRATRTTHPACRVDRPAAAVARWPADWCRWLWARIPTDPFACPRRCADCSV